MDMNPGPAPGTSRNGYVDGQRRRGGSGIAVPVPGGSQHAPEPRRAGVAEDRTGTAGEHRSHPDSIPAESLVADGVNTAMNAVQTLGPHPPPSSSFMDPGAL